MALSLNKTELVNRALSLIGEPAISTIGEASHPGQTAQTVYDVSRVSLLRQHSWNCVTRRKALNLHADAPDFGFTRQFILPVDWMRNLLVNDRDERYTVELSADNKRVILTDSSSVNLIYVADVDDPSLYDAVLTEVLIRRLAAEMCYPITKNIELTRIMRKDYREALEDGKAINAQDRADEYIEADEFIDAHVAGMTDPYRKITAV